MRLVTFRAGHDIGVGELQEDRVRVLAALTMVDWLAGRGGSARDPRRARPRGRRAARARPPAASARDFFAFEQQVKIVCGCAATCPRPGIRADVLPLQSGLDRLSRGRCAQAAREPHTRLRARGRRGRQVVCRKQRARVSSHPGGVGVDQAGSAAAGRRLAAVRAAAGPPQGRSARSRRARPSRARRPCSRTRDRRPGSCRRSRSRRTSRGWRRCATGPRSRPAAPRGSSTARR